MKHSVTPLPGTGKIAVRAINFELDDDLQLATTDKAARLLRHNERIEKIVIELENDTTGADEHQYIAKGRVDFGGPGLLTSVTGEDAARTLDYLVEQLDHQLRRQRRAVLARPAPAAGPAPQARPASGRAGIYPPQGFPERPLGPD